MTRDLPEAIRVGTTVVEFADGFFLPNSLIFDEDPLFDRLRFIAGQIDESGDPSMSELIQVRKPGIPGSRVLTYQDTLWWAPVESASCCLLFTNFYLPNDYAFEDVRFVISVKAFYCKQGHVRPGFKPLTIRV
jgi:hypothetical protein